MRRSRRRGAGAGAGVGAGGGGSSSASSAAGAADGRRGSEEPVGLGVLVLNGTNWSPMPTTPASAALGSALSSMDVWGAGLGPLGEPSGASRRTDGCSVGAGAGSTSAAASTL